MLWQGWVYLCGNTTDGYFIDKGGNRVIASVVLPPALYLRYAIFYVTTSQYSYAH